MNWIANIGATIGNSFNNPAAYREVAQKGFASAVGYSCIVVIISSLLYIITDFPWTPVKLLVYIAVAIPVVIYNLIYGLGGALVVKIIGNARGVPLSFSGAYMVALYAMIPGSFIASLTSAAPNLLHDSAHVLQMIATYSTITQIVVYIIVLILNIQPLVMGGAEVSKSDPAK